MLLYDAAWAPSPRRVRMFLSEKGVTLPVARIDLKAGGHLAPDFLAINPRGLLPVLVLGDGTVIDESSAICRFVEATWPDPALLGATPVAMARIDAWMRRVEADFYGAAVTVFRNTSPAFANRPEVGRWPDMAQLPELAVRGRAKWDGFLDMLEDHLATRDWIAGDAFGAADIWTVVAADFGRAARLSLGDRPAVLRWHAACVARPSAIA